MKLKVDPVPRPSLWALMVPFHKDTMCWQMLSPNPVPPNCLAVLRSACMKGRNRVEIWVFVKPMPVSRTVKVNVWASGVKSVGDSSMTMGDQACTRAVVEGAPGAEFREVAERTCSAELGKDGSGVGTSTVSSSRPERVNFVALDIRLKENAEERKKSAAEKQYVSIPRLATERPARCWAAKNSRAPAESDTAQTGL